MLQPDTNVTLLINKCWQYADNTITLQVISSSIPDRGAVKGYLNINLNQSAFGLNFTDDKNEAKPIMGAVAALFRKYLLRGKIERILQESSSKDIWLVIALPPRGSKPWHIHLQHSKPPLLSLIDPDCRSLLRQGSSGTYTKIGQAKVASFDADNMDLMPQLLSRILPLEATSRAPELEAEHEVTTTTSMPSEQKILRDRLKRKLKTLRGSWQKCQDSAHAHNQIEELTSKAHWLKANIHLVKSDADHLTLEPAITCLDDDITIDLDAQLSASQNLQSYFERIKKLRKGQEINQKLALQLASHIAQLETNIDALATRHFTAEEMNDLKRRHGLIQQPASANKASNARQSDRSLPFRVFAFPDFGKILVGKSAAENDQMVKAAKANDKWFHVVTGTGSHVLVPRAGIVKNCPIDKLQRLAAILAVHYSEHRTSRSTEVYVSERRYLKKQKGMPDGLWKIEHATSQYIAYSEDELSDALKFRV